MRTVCAMDDGMNHAGGFAAAAAACVCVCVVHARVFVYVHAYSDVISRTAALTSLGHDKHDI